MNALQFWGTGVQLVFLVIVSKCSETPTHQSLSETPITTLEHHLPELPLTPPQHHLSSPSPTPDPLPLYTEDQFIPPPRWGPLHGPLVFNSTEEVEGFRERLNNVNNQLLNVTYNSANSLIRLYNDYKLVEHKYGRDLGKFYLDYQPLVHEEHRNCVGLTIALRKRCVEELAKDYPNIDNYLFHTAGEMQLARDNDLLSRDSLRGDEKWKHAALAMHFSIGNRTGYFLLDQSFGVPVVTLMKDKQHPHQDKFSVPHKYSKDEYLYSLCDNGFVNYTRSCLDFLAAEARQGTGGFYLGRAHDSIMDITEKRAIIKTKRSIVSRLPMMKKQLDVDVLLHNGTYIEVYEPGKYFPLYVAGKINLAKTNLSDPDLGLDITLRLKVGRWNEALRLPKYTFLHLVANLSRIAQDHHFLSQLRCLDNVINNHTTRYMTSAEYDNSDMQQDGEDVLYDNFVQYMHQMSSREVFDMWKTFRNVTPGADGQTPWPDHTYCAHYPAHHPNATPRATNESVEMFRTRPFHQNYQVPDLDLR